MYPGYFLLTLHAFRSRERHKGGVTAAAKGSSITSHGKHLQQIQNTFQQGYFFHPPNFFSSISTAGFHSPFNHSKRPACHTREHTAKNNYFPSILQTCPATAFLPGAFLTEHR
jgi:hypothetical protein